MATCTSNWFKVWIHGRVVKEKVSSKPSVSLAHFETWRVRDALNRSWEMTINSPPLMEP